MSESNGQASNDGDAKSGRSNARKALLAIPATVLMPFVLFYTSLKGIWSDQASRGILITAVVLLLAGTVIFMWVEGFKPLDSFYFCFITLSTIGYGDLSPTTDLGKILTVIYGVAGLGILAALVSAIASQRLRARGPVAELEEEA